MNEIISTQNLTRHFNRGRVKALQGVSLRIEAGKIFGLLGPNGAGKTTFIKILLGLQRPDSGSATLFGIPVSDPAARAEVGYLPENHRFPEFLSGAALLDYCGRLSGMRDKQKRLQRAEILLKRVKMWEWRSTRTKKYSKGMVQRLGLAQALLHDPQLIFLDEPTDGVDPIGRKEIRDLLLELKQEGKTIFLNSHLLSEVEMICDEVAILHKGQLLRQGTVQELTTSDKRFRLHAHVGDAELLQQIRSRATAAEAQNGHLDVVVSNVQSLNDVIDLLRQHQVLIQAIMPHKQSLEDSFFQTIQGTGASDLNTVFDTNKAEQEVSA
ncbi:ABC transporter ATP-binding protein [candidate division KSB1 bacterium]|nr:ABC transporter ATP-binding protein [candidate division KSB1 bacterium]